MRVTPDLSEVCLRTITPADADGFVFAFPLVSRGSDAQPGNLEREPRTPFGG